MCRVQFVRCGQMTRERKVPRGELLNLDGLAYGGFKRMVPAITNSLSST